MSQRTVLRGLVLIASFLVLAAPAAATITIKTPGIYGFPVYEVDVTPGASPVSLEAVILYDVATPPTGATQTVTFTGLPAGATTVPSPVSYVPPAPPTGGPYEAVVPFQIAVAAGTAPGAYPILVENAPTPAGSVEVLLVVNGISISPGTVSVVAGTTSGLVTAWVNGYDPQQWFGTQELVFGGLPPGVTTVPSPVTYIVNIPVGAATGTAQALAAETVSFQLAVNPTTPAGTYPISVQNTPAAAGTATFTLVIAPAPTFTVAPGSATISVCPGGPAVQNSITVTPEVGYQGYAFASFPNLPAGITVTPGSLSIPPMPPAQTVSFDVSAEPGLSAGPRVVNVLVQDSFGLSASTSFVVNVGTPDYTAVVSPANLELTPGGPSATVSVSAVPAACPPNSGLAVTPTSIPAGITVIPSGVYLESPSYPPASFTIAASETAPPGTWLVEFTFTADGGPNKTKTVEVVVVPPGGLSAAVEKPSLDVCPGGPGVSNSVTVTPLGEYEGTPTVSFPLLPKGLVITPPTVPVPALPPAQTATFLVSAVAGTSAGPRTVYVLVRDARGVATDGIFTVNVLPPDFAPVASPGAVSLDAGGAAVTVAASLAPGACAPPDTITVAFTGLPPGVTATPASAVLSAPGHAPVEFSLAADGTAPAGTTTATLTFTPPTGVPKTVPVLVTVVRNGRIGVTVERPSVNVCPGGTAGSNTLTISSLEGYVGTPTVTFPGLPATLTVTPSEILVPEVPPWRVVAFTVSAAPGAPAGPTAITALVSDPRGISTEATFVANVLAPDITPAVAPSSLVLNAGGTPGAMSASVVAGSCAPTEDIVVTVAKSELPPGITVTPEQAVLEAPDYTPKSFTFEASPSAAAGSTTVTFAFDPGSGTPSPGGGAPMAVAVVITVCGPPEAPVSPVIRPQGNPQGPVTATDVLELSWGAPTSGFPPVRYEWRLNSGDWTPALGTSATAPPRRVVDPVELFVRAYACTPERGPGAVASSPVYPLAPPVASFAVPASIVAGRAVTFTDTTSPQATSWLWFPGDGIPSTTVQSPTVTFPSPGPRVVVLVASNGSGTSTKATTVNVLPLSSLQAPASLSFRSLDRQGDGRLALGRVEVTAGTTLLLRRLEGEGSAVAYLRLVDGDGRTVVERRLVLAEGEEARHDLSAWGAKGAFRLEVVGPEGLEAAVEELAIRFGDADPEQPVRPRPRKVEIR